MTDVAVPVFAAIVIWWSSTGSLLWLVRQNKSVRLFTALIASIAVLAATVAVYSLRDIDTLSGAYIGFTCGIVLWAWHECMFLFGYISGPRKTPCPPNLKIWPRFIVSTEAVIHHEVAIAAHGGLILLLSLGAENAVAAMTFFLLWGMRLSSKALVFLGAPNISDHMLPNHLKYLSTYFNKKQATALFPLLIAVVSGITAVLIYLGLTHLSGTFPAVSYMLLATLASLAVIEHLALVLPVPDAILWAWAIHENTDTEQVSRRTRPDYGRT
ncbi:MAG: putative photosynthetic complex assembly protein PuhE [Pseudomonadota bacterium]